MEATHENVTLVRNLYAAFSRGAVHALLDAVSPDVEWAEPENPFNPSGGTRYGHTGLLEWLRVSKAAEEVLEIKNGKIESFREFFDTCAAAEAFKPDPRCPSRRVRRTLALLAVFAATFVTFFAFVQPWYARWGATNEEVMARLPGDDIVQGEMVEQTRAITIEAPIDLVWPWLAQLGQNRGGFYSYDLLENLVGAKMPTADLLRPNGQSWTIGDRLWMYPPDAAGGIGYAVLRDYIPGRALAFGTHVPGTRDIDTGSWAFVLRPIDERTTRLLVRSRTQKAPDASWLGRAFNAAVFSPMHFAMERRMMIGLKEVAETGRRSRLSNHIEVGLWSVTVALLAVAVVVVFARHFWGRALVVVCATATLFAYLTLRQPPLPLGVLLVGWLALGLVDAWRPGKLRGKAAILRPATPGPR